MPDTTPDYGDRSVFTIYKGRYAATVPEAYGIDNDTVMLTVVNEVHLLGNVEVTGYTGGSFMVLPESCRPKTTIAVPCAIMVNEQYLPSVAYANPDGSVCMATAETDFVVMTKGVCFNIDFNYYDQISEV